MKLKNFYVDDDVDLLLKKKKEQMRKGGYKRYAEADVIRDALTIYFKKMKGE